MSDNLRVALVTSLVDGLSGPLRRLVQGAGADLDRLDKTASKAGAQLGNLAGKSEALGRTSGPGKLASELDSVGQAADRAATQTGRLHGMLAKAASLARNIGTGVAGLTAARATLMPPLQRVQDYELELARTSNVAYADRNTVEGRQAGQREMDAAIRKATLEGVTRGDALVGLKTLISAGTAREDAMAMLPTIAKFSAAGEADVKDVANIAMKAQQTFGIQPAQMPQAMQMALTAGKLGQFEFKDMAHWLPEQMSIAKNMLGMQGMGDLSTLLAANQFAAKAAGGNNQAGNNLVNFLGKINSQDTANDAKKIGVDLTGTLVRARSKGMDPIDAFVALLRKTAEGDKDYTRLQKQFAAAQASGKKGDQVETLGAMTDLMMGKSVGKLVQDRQALLGLLGIMNDPKGFAEMRRQVRDTQGGAEVDQATLMATMAMKNQQGENAMLNRQFDALQGFGGALGDAQLKIAGLSLKYPEAAAALEGLKQAAIAVAAAFAAMGVANFITGGAAGGAAGGAVGGAIAGGAGAIAKLGAVGLAGAAGLAGGTALYKFGLEGNAGGDFVGEHAARIAAFFGSDSAKGALASMSRFDKQMASDQKSTELQAKVAAELQADKMVQAMTPVIARIEALANRPIQVSIDGRAVAQTVASSWGRESRRN